jgi:hypothetical protein
VIRVLSRFKRLYGASPLHLVGLLACVAVSGLAIQRWFDVGGHDTRLILTWFLALLIGHDLVFVPLYSLVDRILSHRPAARPGPARYARARLHIRVPVMLSGLLLLVFAPLILRKSSGDYGNYAGLSSHPYLGRWLIATACLFVLSAVVYIARVIIDQRRRRPARARRGPSSRQARTR